MSEGGVVHVVRNGVSLTWMVVVMVLVGCASSPVRTYYSPSPLVQPPQGSPLSPPATGAQVLEQALATSPEPKTVVHEVAPLETIWRISRMYGVSADAIRKANNLRSDSLKIGQKLIIPHAQCFRNIVPLYPSTKWRYIIVHHTGTEIGKAFVIHESHFQRGFISGLGYHFLIDNGTLGKGDGQIEVSPRWIKQQDGAHCKAGGMNSMGIGVALVGNFNETMPTQRQMDSLVMLLRSLMNYYKIPAIHVMGHREVPGAATDCPGKLFPWQRVRVALESF